MKVAFNRGRYAFSVDTKALGLFVLKLAWRLVVDVAREMTNWRVALSAAAVACVMEWLGWL